MSDFPTPDELMRLIYKHPVMYNAFKLHKTGHITREEMLVLMVAGLAQQLEATQEAFTKYMAGDTRPTIVTINR